MNMFTQPLRNEEARTTNRPVVFVLSRGMEIATRITFFWLAIHASMSGGALEIQPRTVLAIAIICGLLSSVLQLLIARSWQHSE